jgi:predicted permease
MAILPTDPRDRKAMLMGLRIAGDFGVAIAVPIVIFVIIGQWLEGEYGHAPWFTVLAFIISAVLSGISIYKKAKRYGKEFRDLDKK